MRALLLVALFLGFGQWAKASSTLLAGDTVKFTNKIGVSGGIFFCFGKNEALYASGLTLNLRADASVSYKVNSHIKGELGVSYLIVGASNKTEGLSPYIGVMVTPFKDNPFFFKLAVGNTFSMNNGINLNDWTERGFTTVSSTNTLYWRTGMGFVLFQKKRTNMTLELGYFYTKMVRNLSNISGTSQNTSLSVNNFDIGLKMGF